MSLFVSLDLGKWVTLLCPRCRSMVRGRVASVSVSPPRPPFFQWHHHVGVIHVVDHEPCGKIRVFGRGQAPVESPPSSLTLTELEALR